jgi:hypothetical protein
MKSIPADLRRQVVFRAGDRCEYCGLAQEGQEATFHMDHIVPTAARGATTADNLALACVSCSLRKEARRSARDPQTGRTVPLFNPRRHRDRLAAPNGSGRGDPQVATPRSVLSGLDLDSVRHRRGFGPLSNASSRCRGASFRSLGSIGCLISGVDYRLPGPVLWTDRPDELPPLPNAPLWCVPRLWCCACGLVVPWRCAWCSSRVRATELSGMDRYTR